MLEDKKFKGRNYFIKSTYYDLEQVLNYNEFINGLSKNIYDNLVKSVYDLTTKYKSYQKLSEFVLDSEQYLEIIEKNKVYEEAQKELKSINYKRTLILEENYIGVTMYKNSFIVKEMEFDYYDYEGEYGWEVDKEYVYYTDFGGRLIHPTEKLLDYSLPDENDKLYLLKNCIRLKNNAQDRLRAYEFCDEYNLDVNVFLSTFTYSKMEIHKFSWGGEFSHLLINDIEYKLPKIKELMALYLEYKDMKWINTENNKYVEYPTYTKLTTFLDLLNNQKKYKKI